MRLAHRTELKKKRAMARWLADLGVRAAALVVCASLLAAAGGCKSLVANPEKLVTDPLLPSNHRDWQPNVAVLPSVEIDGATITIRNARKTTYISNEDYVPRYYDTTFRIDQVKSVDFVVVPFKEMPSLAHTMLSFGLDDGQRIVVSAEARLEKGESYSPVLGAMRRYEIMYVIGEERDLILVRTKHRGVDVFVYPVEADESQVQAIFLDILDRVNEFQEKPEFYDTFVNNCTTNIVSHVNRLYPGKILWDPRVLLPGYSDRLAFELGLLEEKVSYELARRKARVTDRANRYADHPNFSEMIRR